ncbi:unnamed protein product, partial [Anisakis simplex]|uniref:Non-specific serine/threonine protein kinase n=1 Tax=Anisakis simplex TaxID=6269 RepID=A0A0M3JJK2_ANISI
MSTFSREFFHANFLDTALKMSTDSVSNIRLQLCHLLPKIKQNLMLPHDESILLRLEKIVREMLCGEQNAHSRQLIQTYACELSRAETKMGTDKVDEAKRREERALWDEESYGSSIRIEADANNNSNVNDDNSNKTKSVDQLMKQQKILSKGTTATSKTSAASRKEQP